MKVLVIISSKYPNPHLNNCIQSLYANQINQNDQYTICIVDSNSDNFENYNNIKQLYKDVNIHYAKNTNYEYGAYLFGLMTYPDNDIYMCIQDGIIVNQTIPLNIIDDLNAYTFFDQCGFHSDHEALIESHALLQGCSLDCSSIINTHFNIAQYCSFIVTKNVIQQIFRTFTHPPINKKSACAYERLFGMFFILNNISTHNLVHHCHKIFQNRL